MNLFTSSMYNFAILCPYKITYLLHSIFILPSKYILRWKYILRNKNQLNLVGGVSNSVTNNEPQAKLAVKCTITMYEEDETSVKTMCFADVFLTMPIFYIFLSRTCRSNMFLSLTFDPANRLVPEKLSIALFIVSFGSTGTRKAWVRSL